MKFRYRGGLVLAYEGDVELEQLSAGKSTPNHGDVPPWLDILKIVTRQQQGQYRVKVDRCRGRRSVWKFAAFQSGMMSIPSIRGLTYARYELC